MKKRILPLQPGLITSLSLLASLLLASARPEHEIPSAFGPYTHPQPKDFAEAKSFTSKDRLVGTYYFYWYCTETKEHIINPENGSDGLTDHPPTLDDFSYNRRTGAEPVHR